MHFIIGILIAVATLVFWMGRAARGAGDIVDAANTIANLPRKRRFQKKYHKGGFDLVESPVEAATVLMISTAKMSGEKRVTEPEELEIIGLLRNEMQMSADDADGLYRQMRNLIHDVVLPESALFPMVAVLKDSIDRDEALDLADMMTTVADVDDEANAEQLEFIRRFRERMGLLH